MMEAYKYHALPQRRFNLQTMRTQPRKSTVGKLYLVGGMDANKGNHSPDRNGGGNLPMAESEYSR